MTGLFKAGIWIIHRMNAYQNGDRYGKRGIAMKTDRLGASDGQAK